MIRTVLAAELVISALLGSWILESDQWLWSSAPSHAYGLLGFVIVDLALAFALARGVSLSSELTLVAAFIQAH